MSPCASTSRTGSSAACRVCAPTMWNTRASGWPMASAAVQPVRRSAVGFMRTTWPCGSVAITASPIDCSVVARFCSLRSSASCACCDDVVSMCVPTMRSGVPSASRSSSWARSRIQTQCPSAWRMRYTASKRSVRPSRWACWAAITRCQSSGWTRELQACGSVSTAWCGSPSIEFQRSLTVDTPVRRSESHSARSAPRSASSSLSALCRFRASRCSSSRAIANCRRCMASSEIELATHSSRYSTPPAAVWRRQGENIASRLRLTITMMGLSNASPAGCTVRSAIKRCSPVAATRPLSTEPGRPDSRWRLNIEPGTSIALPATPCIRGSITSSTPSPWLTAAHKSGA